jgi:hypothetical protein
MLISRNEFQSNVLPHIDCIILSPGPGRPDREEVSSLEQKSGKFDEAGYWICTRSLEGELSRHTDLGRLSRPSSNRGSVWRKGESHLGSLGIQLILDRTRSKDQSWPSRSCCACTTANWALCIAYMDRTAGRIIWGGGLQQSCRRSREWVINQSIINFFRWLIWRPTWCARGHGVVDWGGRGYDPRIKASGVSNLGSAVSPGSTSLHSLSPYMSRT